MVILGAAVCGSTELYSLVQSYTVMDSCDLYIILYIYYILYLVYFKLSVCKMTIASDSFLLSTNCCMGNVP